MAGSTSAVPLLLLFLFFLPLSSASQRFLHPSTTSPPEASPALHDGAIGHDDVAVTLLPAAKRAARRLFSPSPGSPGVPAAPVAPVANCGVGCDDGGNGAPVPSPPPPNPVSVASPPPPKTANVAASPPPPKPATVAASPPPPEPAFGLVSPTGGKGSYKYMVREFLSAHNRVRTLVGEVPFAWDKKLARHARRWSERRRSDCAMVHSMGPYGENMFWGSGWDWRASDAVENWVREHLYYNRSDNSCQPGKMCGHFTQIVWNSSISVGCARVECYAGGVIITCNYDPPGNWVGENPFGTIH